MTEQPTISREQALAAIYNPSTPGAMLSQIATQHRDLHPMIAQHPQVYDTLLQWMSAVAASAPPTPPVVMPSEPTPRGVSAVTGGAAIVPPPYSAATYIPGPPVPGAPVPGPPVPGAPVLVSGATVLAPARRGTGKRTAIVAAVSVVTLALIGTGAYAAYQKFLGPDGGVADSAQALPASTFAMVEIAIEPSTQQKLALSSTWSKLDGVTALLKESGASEDLTRDPGTELRPYIWDAIVEESGLETSLDYDSDIAPWLGGRLAFGMVGTADTPESAFVVAIECKDAEKGLAAVNTLIEESSDESMDALTVQERNGFIVITSAELDLDKAYADGVLSDQAAFSGVIDGLGSRGLASYWLGTYGTAEAISTWLSAEGLGGDADDALANIDRGAAQAGVLRALDNGLEVQSAGVGGAELAGMKGPADAVSQLGALPDTTALAVSVQQMGGMVDSALSQEGSWNSFGQGGSLLFGPLGTAGLGGYGDLGLGYEEDVDQMFAEARSTIEDAMGLSIPDGVNDVFGDGVIFALDQDLNCSVDTGDCASPNIALLVAADDPQEVIDSVEGWGDGEAGAALDEAGIEATVSKDGDVVAWGMGSYAKGLVDAKGDSLSDVSAFRSALPSKDKATIAFYLSGPGLVTIAKDFGAELDADAEDAVDDFAALGMTAYVGADGVTSSRLRIIVAD